MTHKSATFKFVIWTTGCVALGIISWSSTAKRIPPSIRREQGGLLPPVPEIAEFPNPALSRVRLLVSNLN